MNEHEVLVSTKGLEAKGVTLVEGFSEKEIKVAVIGDKKLVVLGEQLKITHFSKQTEELFVTGEIYSLKYQAKGDKVLKRLFK